MTLTVFTSVAHHGIGPTWLSYAIFPDFHAVGGAVQLKTAIGALMTIVLIAAVLMIVVCAAVWAVASSHGNVAAATKARTGLLVALGAAVLDGAALTWLNYLLDIGPVI